MSETNLYHVIYGGDYADDGSVCETSKEALRRYGWFRVVQAEGELEAIQIANEETGSEVSYGEVYFVTPFVQEPTRKIEVIVTV